MTHASARETVALTTVGSFLVLAISWPAFHIYFFGEAFLYLGQYWSRHDRFWVALLGPSDVSFFKPVCFAASLPWYFLLPPDPFAYHVRNFAFSVVNLALLHRVLARMVAAPAARTIALLLFAVSKVHLTTIGYVMIFDSIVMLGLLLSTVLCSARWTATRAPRDRALALVSATLCAFTKDYGVVVVAVVLAIVAAEVWRDPEPTRSRALRAWLSPLALIAAAQLAVRRAIVGPMPWRHPIYAPRLSLVEIGRKGLVFVSALANASAGWHDKTGANGWGSMLARVLPDAAAADHVDALFGAAVVGLVAATLLAARRDGRALLPVAVWIVAFFTPPLFVRNLQIYYAYEPLAGAAVLVGIALASADRRWLRVWSVALVAIALAGAASNDFAAYDWEYAADSARGIEGPVLAAYRDRPLRSLSFVTADVPFWRWVLSADEKAPMLPFLLHRRGLPVRFFDRHVLERPRPALDPADVALDADAEFAPIR